LNVLILGGGARLGPFVQSALGESHRLRVTDVEPLETPHEWMRADVSSLDDVMRAADGMDAIVNLSVLRNDRQLAFDVNTRGPYNMMRAASEHGIRRVVTTGPHFTVAGATYTELDPEISAEAPPHPGTRLYALTKSLGLQVCRLFSEIHDVYVQCHLYWGVRPHDSRNPMRRDMGFWVSWRDAAEAIRLGLEVDLSALPTRCEVFNILTDSPHGRFSNQKARRILRFRPRDQFEYASEVRSPC